MKRSTPRGTCRIRRNAGRMKTFFVKARSLVLVGGIMLTVAGCRTTAWSPDKQKAYQLQRRLNAWWTVVQYPIADVHEAALAGLKDLDIRPITNRADKVSALIDGLFADNMDFEIRLEAVAEKSTRVTIKCGMFGNEDRARLLFDALTKHLP